MHYSASATWMQALGDLSEHVGGVLLDEAMPVTPRRLPKPMRAPGPRATANVTGGAAHSALKDFCEAAGVVPDQSIGPAVTMNRSRLGPTRRPA